MLLFSLKLLYLSAHHKQAHLGFLGSSINLFDVLAGYRVAKQLARDVVIMDINLPGMNGLQVTRELKSVMPDIAVIMLTAYHDDEQIFHAVRAGAAVAGGYSIDDERTCDY